MILMDIETIIITVDFTTNRNNISSSSISTKSSLDVIRDVLMTDRTGSFGKS